MQITHEEARRLIQFNADAALKDGEKARLDEHLVACQECRHYAGEIREVGLILTPILQRKWNRLPLPQQQATAVPRSRPYFTQSFLLATRMVAMGVICIAVLFNIWQFSQSTGPGSGSSSANIPPVPTPSMFSTTTNVLTENPDCKQILYTVQEHESLMDVADQFSISLQEIMMANKMQDNSVHPSMKLWIPVCGSTTPGTPGTVQTVLTPLLDPTTSTPVNRPTQ